MKIVELYCPYCAGVWSQGFEKNISKDKRPTKNLDSLIKAINMSGATVSINQFGTGGRWTVFIHDNMESNVLSFYTTPNNATESMYQAVKNAGKLVTDRVISLCGYKPITI